jgi:hypothetical protein
MNDTAMTAPVSDAVARLTQALDEVANALAAADLERLLAAEPALAAALDGVTAGGAVDRQVLDGARSALLRCRRLGAGLVAFTRLSLDPAGTQVYSRYGTGQDAEQAPRGVAMEARG